MALDWDDGDKMGGESDWREESEQRQAEVEEVEADDMISSDWIK